jgi:hypothetical protein
MVAEPAFWDRANTPENAAIDAVNTNAARIRWGQIHLAFVMGSPFNFDRLLLRFQKDGNQYRAAMAADRAFSEVRSKSLGPEACRRNFAIAQPLI